MLILWFFGDTLGPAGRMANKDPDIHHTIKEDGQEITQLESKAEQKVDGAHVIVESDNLTTELPNLTDIATKELYCHCVALLQDLL